MSAARSTDAVGGDGVVGVDTMPLIVGNGGGGGDDRSPRGVSRRPSLRGAARFLRRASSRRMMREPSMLVREAAAEHLEERQSEWAYSRPVVVLDILWNLAFVAVAAGVLVSSLEETPSMPLRLWIGGYALQCVLHVVCICIEYQRRRQSPRDGVEGGGSRSRGSSGPSSPRRLDEVEDYGVEQILDEDSNSIAKHLESANTMFSFIWWIIGFYWVSVGGQALTRDAPQLYWLCIVFLAFDVFFVVFCVALACVIGIAVCCCLPCIIALLYAVADQQEGASDEDIHQLPKFKFRRVEGMEKVDGEMQKAFGGVMTECDSATPTEHVLSADDAECCICLSAYDDGAELRELPCNHHFHCACVDKWLYINAICPLCKYNIAKRNQNGREEV